MTRRKQTSGGQALVMVTLGLLAMAGVMGLAVDLGWSFFVEKEAQAAADGAALGSAQEAMARFRASGVSVSGFTCSANGVTNGSDDTKADCETVPCGSVNHNSNLYNGCQYALKNGFDWTNATARQNVSLQANDGVAGDLPTSGPGAAPGITNLSYWVTATVVQQIPQLFSAVLGNQNSTVAAVATAAIAASENPGNFFGMNQAGDCWGVPGSTTNCGVDIINGSKGGGANCPGTSVSAGVCAPSGMVIASNCNSSLASSLCTYSGGAYAADGGSVNVMTNSLLVNGTTGQPATQGALQNANNFINSNGTTISPSYTTNPSNFKDVYANVTQPPLFATPGGLVSGIPSCGITGTLSGNVGPFQYYMYSTKDASGLPKPTGVQIQSSSITTVTSTSATSCTAQPGGYFQGGIVQPYSNFPTYIFYGGLNDGGTTTLAAGQYVFAGVKSAGDNILNLGGTWSGDSSTGTMLITTDTNYPYLRTQLTNVPNYSLNFSGSENLTNLYQGGVEMKNDGMNIFGVVPSVTGSNLPSALNAYSGIVFWQDRRNSSVEYNDLPSLAPNCGTYCTGDDGSVVACASGCPTTQTTAMIVTDNHVSANSPSFDIQPGHGAFNMTGVLYQPRGAWITVTHGNGNGSGSLQIITGSLETTSGNDAILLQGPTNPIVTFKATLIH